jgi:hypothetical protein
VAGPERGFSCFDGLAHGAGDYDDGGWRRMPGRLVRDVSGGDRDGAESEIESGGLLTACLFSKEQYGMQGTPDLEWCSSAVKWGV